MIAHAEPPGIAGRAGNEAIRPTWNEAIRAARNEANDVKGGDSGHDAQCHTTGADRTPAHRSFRAGWPRSSAPGHDRDSPSEPPNKANLVTQNKANPVTRNKANLQFWNEATPRMGVPTVLGRGG